MTTLSSSSRRTTERTCLVACVFKFFDLNKLDTNDEHQYQRTPYSFGGYFGSVKCNIVFVLTDFAAFANYGSNR